MDTQYSGMGAGGGVGAETPPAAESGAKNTVVLSADHFPEGMSPKQGDKLMFMVTAPADSEGNVTGYFESAGNAEAAGDEWEKEFVKSMSPSSPESEAQ